MLLRLHLLLFTPHTHTLVVHHHFTHLLYTAFIQGLLMELGPCIVNPGGNGTRINKHSWNNKANIIFLDQPVNTGFSWTDGKEVSSTEEGMLLGSSMGVFWSYFT